jgi:alkanesulfonate monooxygenase SsuD/methylene tetrahydromethanopterin reductase-like flavin-dependent oxidoreductase (luciferase family)
MFDDQEPTRILGGGVPEPRAVSATRRREVGPMKVGIMLPSMYPVELNLEVLRLAEAMGTDSVWMPDHMLGFFHPDLWSETPSSQFSDYPDGCLDPFCLSAALAMQTALPLGIGVTDGTRRRAPDVARSALTLHHMCRGGFNLGIGSGEAESLVPFGYPFDKPVGRCEEFLAELRCLLDTGHMPQGGPLRNPGSSGRSSSENQGIDWPSCTKSSPSRSSSPSSSKARAGNATASNIRPGRRAGDSWT